jgi:hypothetical protein
MEAVTEVERSMNFAFSFVEYSAEAGLNSVAGQFLVVTT